MSHAVTDAAHAPLGRLLDRLKAAADPSRLRLLAVCAEGEWTVSELVRVLGQSQPRVSRHLRILADAGLLERVPEGAWVFYRRAVEGPGAELLELLLRHLPGDDATLAADRERLQQVREQRRREVEAFFDSRALVWNSERDLGVDGARVDGALLELVREQPVRALLDVGTGTGHVLRLLAPYVDHAVGIDISRDMLKVARVELDRAGIRNAHVRQVDMYALPFPERSFDLVTFHQVLHFADDPAAALAEAARVLEPGGRLVVVDLARHGREDLRTLRRHRRLGFDDDEMNRWFRQLGLEPQAPRRLAGEDLTVVLWPAARAGRPARRLGRRAA